MQMSVMTRFSSVAAFLSLVFLLATLSQVESRNPVQTNLSPLLLYLDSQDSGNAVDQKFAAAEQKFQLPNKRNAEEKKLPERCKAQQDRPELLFVMEQVCIHCNEFYSHEQSNVRSRCRSDCFGTDLFKMCLNHFTKKDPSETM